MPRRVFSNLRAFFEAQRELRQAGKPFVTSMELADELGISYPYLSMIKWGDRQPDLELALRIAERCHVPLESLLRRQKKAS
jgi:transcriptional regulator with XRE-family HTH domain